jgi:hypothetical protein
MVLAIVFLVKDLTYMSADQMTVATNVSLLYVDNGLVRFANQIGSVSSRFRNALCLVYDISKNLAGHILSEDSY